MAPTCPLCSAQPVHPNMAALFDSSIHLLSPPPTPGQELAGSHTHAEARCPSPLPFSVWNPAILPLVSQIPPCVCAKSLRSCPTVCCPMDCSLPGSSVRGILQAGILEWISLLSSRGSSQPRDRTASLTSATMAGRFFIASATWEALAQIPGQQQYAPFLLAGSHGGRPRRLEGIPEPAHL